jgi:hypothetical protein
VVGGQARKVRGKGESRVKGCGCEVGERVVVREGGGGREGGRW